MKYLHLLAVVVLLCSCGSREEYRADSNVTWTRYEGEPGATSYSALDQINDSNVSQLRQAWVYEVEGASAVNPIVSDSLVFLPGPGSTVVAVHGGTGREVWSYEGVERVRTNGLMYWESEDRSDRRVLFPHGSKQLIALDAWTGEPVSEFGDGGVLDLTPGLGIDASLVTRATGPSPGVVYEDILIMGSSPGEGYFAAPGHIRGFNVRTGEQLWIFHTLPREGEVGYDTWPAGRSDRFADGQAYGGANAWGGLSVDVNRGIVYVPLGSANYDFYGVDRPGQNLFANSLVALDARTGERRWHFQTVHHDLWDYDLTATPVLLTVDHEGSTVDIVALATKTGQVFVFDRESGEPLWPIEERPVPPSTMPGEQAWPTQPFATKPEPFVPLTFDLEADLNPHLDPADRDSLIDVLRAMRYEGMYTPPSTEPTLQVPGNRGGANWGSTAGDPRDGTFYVLSYNMPSVLQLHAITAGNTGTGGSPVDRGQAVYEANCEICHGARFQGSPNSGIPSLVGVTDRLSHADLKQVIQVGQGQMPGFPQLDDRELDGLQMYLSNPELALTEGGAAADDENVETLPSPTMRYQSGWNHVLDSRGVPMIQPPWFRLTAYDLNEGEIKWQIPVGDVAHLAEEGITGTGTSLWLRGGPAVTGGGLIFQSNGGGLAAYSTEDGSLLWSAPLPGLVGGTPAVYEVDGRQFVVVSVSEGYQANRPSETPAPGYYAFALP